MTIPSHLPITPGAPGVPDVPGVPDAPDAPDAPNATNNTAARSPAAPATLDHAGIAARVPHAGSMCLLHSLLAWDAVQIRCSATSHADMANPLRHGGQLPSPCAIEYAAQAMALHGALCAEHLSPGAAPKPGFLASARQVRLLVPRLDDVPGAITVQATRLAGDGNQALYSFALLSHDGATLVDGRAAVVLNTPLPVPISTPHATAQATALPTPFSEATTATTR